MGRYDGMTTKLFDNPIDISVNDLMLDCKNIRFGHMGTSLTEEQIEIHLWDEEDCRILYKQIVHDRQVYQPLYVKKNEDGKYIVKEGNRRLVTLRRINADIKSNKLKGFAADAFSKVRCFILNASDKEIEFFLGTIHVTGPKEWATANKAMHIFNLIDVWGETKEAVAEELGLTKGRVDTYYLAFKATRDYGSKYAIGDVDGKYLRKYSYFDELYKSKDLREWINDNGNLDMFMQWLANDQLRTYMDVRRIRDILKGDNPEKTVAITAIKNGTNVEKACKSFKETSVGDNWGPIYKALKHVKAFPANALREAIRDSEKLSLLAELVMAATGLQQQIQKMQREGGMSP